METKRVIERLANGEYGEAPDSKITKDRLIDELYNDINPLCETETQGEGGNTTLWDWLYQGDYSGDETAEALAAEWDKLSEVNNATN